MATYTSYDQVGLAEDVSDVISNITPTKTPFQSSIKDEKVSARIYEWQEDELRAVKVNAQIEGFTAADGTIQPTVMRTNTVQIFEETIKVAATADAVKTYGRAKETAYQLAKAGEALKRDVEHAMVGIGVQAAVTGTSSVARKFASTVSQLDAGVVNAAAAALTEDAVLALHQELYSNGADPSVMQITPSNSLIVADFAYASGRERDAKQGTKLVNVVNLYVSPFGELRVVLNRFLNSDYTFLYDPAMWCRAVLRNWTRTMLAKTGDNEMHMIVGEFGLKHKNFKASGVIQDTTA